jgi:hypothetical protein
VPAAAAVLLLLTAPAATAQTFEQRGFAEGTFTGYPQTHAVNPERTVGEVLGRWDPSLALGRLRFDLSVDGRFDSYGMTEDRFAVTFWDRTIQRPVAAVRQLSASWTQGLVTVALGKQFIRWGKTDIVVPTDRFTPRDYLNVINTEVLAVTAARVVLANATSSLDLVYVPKMTPSRIPLFDQRWVILPPEARGLPIADDGSHLPRHPQYGLRFNHIGRFFEFSVSGYRGVNHLPLINVALEGAATASPRLHVRREYPQLTAAGGDIAAPLPWFTIKAEGAWQDSTTPMADEFVLYVVQLERQVGEWLFVAGYAGEHRIRFHQMLRFTPDRGLSRSIVGRAGLTIDTNRSLAVETVARQNGDGFYNKFEYSQAVGPNLRFTGVVAIFRGSEDDFLGQYERNSFGSLTVRFSF